MADSINLTVCSNQRHPDGAWHPAAPLPGPGDYIEELRQAYRRAKYGCGCARIPKHKRTNA